MEVIPDQLSTQFTRSDEPRTAEERHRKRIARLQSLLAGDGSSLDEQVGLARYYLWQKQQPSHVRLRSAFVLREGSQGATPIRAISASKSAAVQLLLMSFFENQCRSQRRDSDRTPVPLARPTDETGTAWLYLLALPTVDRQGGRTQARPPNTNRLAQLKNGLARLEEFRRVELRAPAGTRGRFEHFRLLNEVADNRAGNTYYKAPRPDEFTIDIPANFFLNGWVHALTDNEIIAYLFLLHQAKMRPEENSGAGMLLPARAWTAAFELDRAYEGYRLLSRYGLVRILRDERRRADGTLEGLNEGLDEDVVIEPHRFWVDTSALDKRAVPEVISGLEGFIEGEDLDTVNGFQRGFFGEFVPAQPSQ